MSNAIKPNDVQELVDFKPTREHSKDADQMIFEEVKYQPLPKEAKKRRRQNRLMRRASRNTARFKRRTRIRNRRIHGIKKDKKSLHIRRQMASEGHVHVAAPIVMSFIENPEGVANFAATLKSLYEKRKPVWIDMREVTRIDFDGIAVLLAAAVRFKAKKLISMAICPAIKKSLTCF